MSIDTNNNIKRKNENLDNDPNKKIKLLLDSDDDYQINPEILKLLIDTNNLTFVENINKNKDKIVRSLVKNLCNYTKINTFDGCSFTYKSISIKKFNMKLKDITTLTKIFSLHGINFCEYLYFGIMQSNIKNIINCYMYLLLSTALFKVGKEMIIDKSFVTQFLSCFRLSMITFNSDYYYLSNNLFDLISYVNDYLKKQQIIITMMAKIFLFTKINIYNNNNLNMLKWVIEREELNNYTFLMDEDIKNFIFEIDDDEEGFTYQDDWNAWIDQEHINFAKKMNKKIIEKASYIPKNFVEFLKKNELHEFSYSDTNNSFYTVTSLSSWKKAMLECI